MHTTFNVFPYLITLLLVTCEGTSVLYNGTTVLYNGTTVLYKTGIFTVWCYMNDILSVDAASLFFRFKLRPFYLPTH